MGLFDRFKRRVKEVAEEVDTDSPKSAKIRKKP